jgi:metal-dependent hydrolase (beta-lactamase superfamily II)
MQQFNEINSNPIAAIIYTHNHGDHTLGAKYFVDQQDDLPLVIAHESTAKSVEKIFGILNPIISSRSSKMFGTMLPEERGRECRYRTLFKRWSKRTWIHQAKCYL